MIVLRLNLKIVVLICFFAASGSIYGQDELQNKVDALQRISDMPYICRDTVGDQGCGQTEFWDVVTEKLRVIPYLLESLDDTTLTAATVPNFGGRWTVADISYRALQEILKDIPTFEFLGISYDGNGCGYCSYWIHLRDDIRNRKAFKNNATEWYEAHKHKLMWVADKTILTCDCSFDHPNAGYYLVKN